MLYNVYYDYVQLQQAPNCIVVKRAQESQNLWSCPDRVISVLWWYADFDLIEVRECVQLLKVYLLI